MLRVEREVPASCNVVGARQGPAIRGRIRYRQRPEQRIPVESRHPHAGGGRPAILRPYRAGRLEGNAGTTGGDEVLVRGPLVAEMVPRLDLPVMKVSRRQVHRGSERSAGERNV